MRGGAGGLDEQLIGQVGLEELGQALAHGRIFDLAGGLQRKDAGLNRSLGIQDGGHDLRDGTRVAPQGAHLKREVAQLFPLRRFEPGEKRRRVAGGRCDAVALAGEQALQAGGKDIVSLHLCQAREGNFQGARVAQVADAVAGFFDHEGGGGTHPDIGDADDLVKGGGGIGDHERLQRHPDGVGQRGVRVAVAHQKRRDERAEVQGRDRHVDR